MTETSRTSEFTIYFQRSVLNRILDDTKFALIAKKILKPDHFDTDSFRWIYRKILSGKIASVEALVSEIKEDQKRDRINDDLRKAVVSEIKVFTKGSKKVFTDAEYGLSKLKKFIDTQELADGLYRAASRLKDGEEPDKIKVSLRQVLNTDMEEGTSTVDLVLDSKDRFQIREEMVKSGKLMFVPTGIKKLDDELKGPMLGQMWAFFGDTNSGKSALATNIGRTCFVLGFKTWHITIEDQAEMTKQRYDTSLSRVTYEKFTFCDYTSEEKKRIDKIFQILKEKRSEFIFISKIEEGCTMSDIQAEYERIQIAHNFYPTVVLIDSPHCMEPIIRREKVRLDYKQIYQEIRRFARSENVAVFLFDQSRQEDKGKLADTSASSESYDKARISDGFITINQTKIQKKEGVLQFYIAKMKDREKGMSFFVRPRMGIMRFESVEN